ncbi:MAG: prolyl oligopeptidase family serine peptidase [Gemmatimonadota bacterium]
MSDASPPARATRYPATRISAVTEELHGQLIVDPYRWLEEDESPDTVSWTRAQNAATERYLEAAPGRAAIRARLEELLSIGAISTPTPVRGRYFYQLREGGQNQPVLLVRMGLDGHDQVLLDPNALNPAGTTALDWFYPSDDGRLVAYGVSEDGSEDSVLSILEVETGKLLSDRIRHTRAADLSWLPDSTGFYYTRYPSMGEVPEGDEHYHRSVFFHLLGEDPASDRLVFRPEQKEFWPGVDLSPDGRWLLIGVSRSFDETDIYIQDLEGGGPLVPVAKDLPALFDAAVVRDRLYLRTNLEAPNYRVFVAEAANPGREFWRPLVLPRSNAVLEGLSISGNHLILSYVERATSRLVVTDLAGNSPREIELPAIGSVFGLGVEWDGAELLIGFSSFIVPPAIYRVDLQSGRMELWHRVAASINPDRFRVDQVSYPSRDGTTVTMFIVRPADLHLDGERPVYLTGYGGFNISMMPTFSRSMLLWLEAGGIIAIPNLRGGGEYGEAWHQDGMLGKKQNSFDDFTAAAEYLIREGYTSPSHIAAAGGSNGGLLMGAVLTQRSDLFRAVIIQVPLLDMLRYHRFLMARLWIPEYGSAENREEFAWLIEYSPYHKVRDGVGYPAVLLATAESDTRVHPMHARKMAARLQAATSSIHPILLRLETQAGHGAGKPISKLVDELTDTWTFVFTELGVPVPGLE